MRIFSYRNKQILRRVLLIVLCALLLAVAFVVARIVYLGRFAVYTADGRVYFDREQLLSRSPAAPAASPEGDYPFQTILDAASEEQTPQAESLQLRGVYISTTMLANHLAETRQALENLDEDCNAVLIDVKSPLGNFYYATRLSGAQTADADIEACTALMKSLIADRKLTVIARVPAFSDPNYIEQHDADALALRAGGLWMDERRCYWMNPSAAGVQGYLTSIALELADMGFDEVLFDQFYVPEDSAIAWDDAVRTRAQAINDCADALHANLTGTSLLLSFGSESPDLAEYASRLYITTEKASDVQAVSQALQPALGNLAPRLVFITSSHDTHFDSYGIIRALLSTEE